MPQKKAPTGAGLRIRGLTSSIVSAWCGPSVTDYGPPGACRNYTRHESSAGQTRPRHWVRGFALPFQIYRLPSRRGTDQSPCLDLLCNNDCGAVGMAPTALAV